jgi:hypothetical protein
MPMGIPYDFMIISELLLIIPIQWGHIKDLVAFAVSRVGGLLHFENIHFQGRTNYKH